jgi:hypothetical protein
MKRLIYNKVLFVSGILMILLQLSIVDMQAQDEHQAAFLQLKDCITNVTIDKDAYTQSIEIENADKGKIQYIRSVTDSKGKSSKEQFIFYSTDIDQNTLVVKSSEKKNLIHFEIANKQKFIRYLKDGKPDTYLNVLDIFASSAENAAEMLKRIKNCIQPGSSVSMTWNKPSEALLFLQNSIGTVKHENSTVKQVFQYDEANPYLVTLTATETNQKGESVENKYLFNILDINKNLITLKVQGTKMIVYLETKGNDRFIQCYSKNVIQNYRYDVEIFTEDADMARNIIAALNVAISQLKAATREYKSLAEAYTELNTIIPDGVPGYRFTKQTFEAPAEKDAFAKLFSAETDAKGKTVDNTILFYFCDIDPVSLNIEISGKQVTIHPKAYSKQKYFKQYKNTELDEYMNSFDIVCADIENGRRIINALKYVINNSVPKPGTFASAEAALASVSDILSKNGTECLRKNQNIMIDSKESSKTVYAYETVDVKGKIKHEKFEFYSIYMDPEQVTIEVKSKGIRINVPTTNMQPGVKVFEDDIHEGYDLDLEFEVYDIKDAKQTVEALKYFIRNAKPKAPDFSNKQKAMDYIRENASAVYAEWDQVEQVVDFVENDPCKLQITRTKTDSKGKKSEERFEFSAADLNKMMVEIKVSGKKVSFLCETRGKQKSVKVYKDSSQQAYGNEIVIYSEDYNIARHISDALVQAITLCE